MAKKLQQQQNAWHAVGLRRFYFFSILFFVAFKLNNQQQQQQKQIQSVNNVAAKITLMAQMKQVLLMGRLGVAAAYFEFLCRKLKAKYHAVVSSISRLQTCLKNM